MPLWVVCGNSNPQRSWLVDSTPLSEHTLPDLRTVAADNCCSIRPVCACVSVLAFVIKQPTEQEATAVESEQCVGRLAPSACLVGTTPHGDVDIRFGGIPSFLGRGRGWRLDVDQGRIWCRFPKYFRHRRRGSAAKVCRHLWTLRTTVQPGMSRLPVVGCHRLRSIYHGHGKVRMGPFCIMYQVLSHSAARPNRELSRSWRKSMSVSAGSYHPMSAGFGYEMFVT